MRNLLTLCILSLRILSLSILITLPSAHATTLVAPLFSVPPGPLDSISAECKKSGVTNLCIAALLALRCKQLDPFLPFIGDFCALSATRVPGILDVTRFTVHLKTPTGAEGDYNLPVIFTGKLLRMVEDPAVQKYLDDLPSNLREAVNAEKPLSLLDFTANYAGSQEAAMEWIAVLFQDTSWVHLHHRFLLNKLVPDDGSDVDPTLYRTLVRMGEALEILEPGSLFTSGAFNFIHVYPENAGDTENLNLSFYHYYPMALLSHEMRHEGFGARLSFFLSYLFNSEYEFQTLDPAAWPLSLPKPFPGDATKTANLKDLYAGFMGALYGVNRVSKKGFSNYSVEFAKNPTAHLRTLLFALPK